MGASCLNSPSQAILNSTLASGISLLCCKNMEVAMLSLTLTDKVVLM